MTWTHVLAQRLTGSAAMLLQHVLGGGHTADLAKDAAAAAAAADQHDSRRLVSQLPRLSQPLTPAAPRPPAGAAAQTGW